MTVYRSANAPTERVLTLDPAKMTRLSRKFASDAHDFHGSVGPIRASMRDSAGGFEGWPSAVGNPVLMAVIANHLGQQRTADAFLGAVTDDLEIMGRTTKALSDALSGQDDDNGLGLGRVAEAAKSEGA
ncbi:MAG TPA: hypothetical protein VE172_14800 [Stackebrandtia sp.]|uniref:hypothetical protein n=1 Tax=Stackebrandtia sp. TaxID=2023065 RepID=UPI002D33528C|nr:hypothetical protein [Stackebrandtia sp.]HZE40073.1 hypothetical protein [Stackebrandtia sp.]